MTSVSRLHPIPFLVFSMFFVIACSSQKGTSREKDEGKESQASEGEPDEQTKKELRSVKVMEKSWNPEDPDSFRYKKVARKGDRLTLLVRYSGGCKPHAFELRTKKQYSKSMPPSIRLFLHHDANGDACRSVLTDTLRYDLKKLQHPKSDTLLLHLKQRERPIQYAY